MMLYAVSLCYRDGNVFWHFFESEEERNAFVAGYNGPALIKLCYNFEEVRSYEN